MRKHFRLSAACAAALLYLAAPVSAAPDAQTPARYWYDGATKVPIYVQPQLYAPSSQRAVPPGAPRIRTSRNTTPIYERAPQGQTDPSALTVYSTKADWRSSRLMVQGPGVLFTVADGMSAQRAEAWLATRGLRAEPIADGTVFKVGGVTGEHALDLANAIYESGLVKYAQPNWVREFDR
jgi:hypothetical protein